MPKTTAGIQTDYVIDITTEVQTQVEETMPIEFPAKLIGLEEFITLFRKTYPDSSEDPTKIWHNLLGNEPSGEITGLNLNVQHLTPDSCAMILKHYKLFISGIDFGHLPSGFFLTKNPQNSIRNVLHYSDFIAQNKPQTDPLAIVLTPKIEEPLGQAHDFPSPASEWYEFLCTKMKSGTTVFCTEKELKKAFIAFSNLLSRLQLSFPKPDFTRLNKDINPYYLKKLSMFFNDINSVDSKDFNPIVLLGYWARVLTQPHLKKMDIPLQWECLPQMDFTRGYNPLRAITDYQNTETPCGFVLPEMLLLHTWIENGSHKYDPMKPLNSFWNLGQTHELWRYIAYRPHRNSINFYKKAFEQIDTLPVNDSDLFQLELVLASTTTSPKEETFNDAEELVTWSSLCQFIHNSTHKSEFIGRIKELWVPPNMLFLKSLLECMEKNITTIGKLGSLETLFKKLSQLLELNGAGFYRGARFYFVNGVWDALGMQEYIELQFELHTYNSCASIIVPHLSTFGIKTIRDGKDILNKIKKIPAEHQKNIISCLNFFKDAIGPLPKEALIQIINDMGKKQPSDSLLLLLSYVQQHFGATNSFPKHYFAQKRQQLLDAEQGLNQEQKGNVHALGLLDSQSKAIISIESALIRKNNMLTSAQFNPINEQFVELNYLLGPADCSLFLQRLQSMHESMPEEIEVLQNLLHLLLEHRSLEAFNQMYCRNQIEQCADPFLIEKFIFFIKHLKPIGKRIENINTQTVQDLLATLVLNSNWETIGGKGFMEDINLILVALKEIIQIHPHVQHHLLNAFYRMPNKGEALYFQNISTFIKNMMSLAMLFSAKDKPEDMLTFFALLAYYNQHPIELVTLWKKLEPLEQNQQKFLLTFISHLLETEQSKEELDILINTIKNKPIVYETLVNTCSNPPYPAIKDLNKWLSQDNFEEQYQTFSMRPYGSRHIPFAFKHKEFAVQQAQFKGVAPELFTPELADVLDKQLKQNRTRGVEALQREFQSLAHSNPLTLSQKQQLLCICVEMLARTASQWDHSTPPKRISQELNTTQVLALYALLTHPKSKVIGEIDTGEGKSRIMMILAACQVAQGKTVDFMTSDMPLAERDYLVYNAFFKGLGIRTSLISLNTPPQLYQKGGVNFSDNSQLLLLRNKSDIDQEPYSYLNEHPEERCLLIDEVDKFIHDKSKDSYNYASQSNTLKGYVWIYPFLVRFVRHKLAQEPNKPFKAEELINEFTHFVAVHDIDQSHQADVALLKEKSPQQLITWITGAHTALNMNRDKDYKITGNHESELFLIRDSEGYIRYTRKVLVIDNGRPVEGSTFSSGVHQCLCAIENEYAGKEEFAILPENETQRSSYPVSFMAQYAQGAIYGTSGTTRSAAPISSSVINYEDYGYIRVPRQKELRREDKNVWAAKDEKQQIAFLKRSILQKLKEKAKRPVLLICKDDEQSKLLYEVLSTDPKLMKLVAQCTRVHGLTTKNEELKAIKEAGKPGVLTLSTVGMFGRGVDINADNLYVAAAYVPTLEDEIQIKGRTGRAGKPGEYRMIINLADSQTPVKGTTYNIHNEVDKAQKTMALTAVNQEEISKLYAEFLEHIHQKFLADYRGREHDLRLLEDWQKYLNELQKNWANHSPQLLLAIEQGNKEQFINLFSQFTQEWEKKATFIKQGLSDFTSERAQTIYNSLLEHNAFFKPERKKIKVQKEYDLGDDGQARVYSTLFAQTRAVLRGERSLFADYHAWREGRGELFPDLMATLRGERPIFANLRATIARLIEALKALFTNQEKPAPATEEDLGEEPTHGPT